MNVNIFLSLILLILFNTITLVTTKEDAILVYYNILSNNMIDIEKSINANGHTFTSSSLDQLLQKLDHDVKDMTTYQSYLTPPLLYTVSNALLLRERIVKLKANSNKNSNELIKRDTIIDEDKDDKILVYYNLMSNKIVDINNALLEGHLDYSSDKDIESILATIDHSEKEMSGYVKYLKRPVKLSMEEIKPIRGALLVLQSKSKKKITDNLTNVVTKDIEKDTNFNRYHFIKSDTCMIGDEGKSATGTSINSLIFTNIIYENDFYITFIIDSFSSRYATFIAPQIVSKQQHYQISGKNIDTPSVNQQVILKFQNNELYLTDIKNKNYMKLGELMNDENTHKQFVLHVSEGLRVTNLYIVKNFIELETLLGVNPDVSSNDHNVYPEGGTKSLEDISGCGFGYAYCGTQCWSVCKSCGPPRYCMCFPNGYYGVSGTFHPDEICIKKGDGTGTIVENFATNQNGYKVSS